MLLVKKTETGIRTARFRTWANALIINLTVQNVLLVKKTKIEVRTARFRTWTNALNIDLTVYR